MAERGKDFELHGFGLPEYAWKVCLMNGSIIGEVETAIGFEPGWVADCSAPFDHRQPRYATAEEAGAEVYRRWEEGK